MAHPMMLPTVAMLALVGTGLGVHLGKEAISEINPLYFTMPEGTKSYAALTPQGIRTDAPPPLTPASEMVGLGNGCPGCRSMAIEFAPPQPSEALYAERSWDIEAYVEPVASEDLGSINAERDGERMLIQTYSSYPITVEEQRLHRLAIEQAVEREFEREPVVIEEPVQMVETVGL